MSATVRSIHVAAAEGAPMEALAEAQLVAGKGIQGDRNFGGNPNAGVTLVAESDLQAVAASLGVPYTPGFTRRNLTVVGIDPQTLLGKRFRIGEAVLEGTFDAAPCQLMETCVGPGAHAALAGKAGIRAKVIEGGTIRPDDALELVANPSEVTSDAR